MEDSKSEDSVSLPEHKQTISDSEKQKQKTLENFGKNPKVRVNLAEQKSENNSKKKLATTEKNFTTSVKTSKSNDIRSSNYLKPMKIKKRVLEQQFSLTLTLSNNEEYEFSGNISGNRVIDK